MSWEYDVKEHKFYLDGVYQFDADYAGATGYKNDPSQECVKKQRASAKRYVHNWFTP